MAKYDLAIIGSGPGGYNTAIRASQWGLKTLVIEKDGFLGGTCLHVGCIPTKVLLHTAEIYDTLKNAKEFGIDVKEFTLNWAAALARKEMVVNKHAKGIEFLFRKNKVEKMQGWGRWAGPGRVSVEKDGKITEVEATHIMFGTGSAARSLPGIEIDGKTILSNIEILQLPAVPKTLVIVGAGAVGVEFASIFNSFGTQVTVLEMLPRVTPVEDEEISAELEKALKKKGIQIFTEAKVESVKKDAQGATVAFTDKAGKTQTISAERVLMAVGRVPKTENLGLEKSKAKLERGFVHVGPYMETAEPRLYAIGDIVAGMPQLAHAASMEGITCVAKITGKTDAADRKDAHPQRDLLRAAGGVDRLDRARGARGGLRGEDRKISVPRKQQGDDSGPSRRLHQSRDGRKDRRNSRRAHHRAVRDRNYCGIGRGPAARSHRGRSDVHRARASDGLGSDVRRGCGGARAVDQCVADVIEA